jgi:hypothetical protein
LVARMAGSSCPYQRAAGLNHPRVRGTLLVVQSLCGLGLVAGGDGTERRPRTIRLPRRPTQTTSVIPPGQAASVSNAATSRRRRRQACDYNANRPRTERRGS